MNNQNLQPVGGPEWSEQRVSESAVDLQEFVELAATINFDERRSFGYKAGRLAFERIVDHVRYRHISEPRYSTECECPLEIEDRRQVDEEIAFHSRDRYAIVRPALVEFSRLVGNATDEFKNTSALQGLLETFFRRDSSVPMVDTERPQYRLFVDILKVYAAKNIG